MTMFLGKTVGLGAFAGAVLWASGAFAMPAAGAFGPVGATPADGLVTEARACAPGYYYASDGRCYRSGVRPPPPPSYRPPPPRAYRPPPPPSYRPPPPRVRCWVQHTPAGPRRVCR